MAGPLNQSDIDKLVAEAAQASAPAVFQCDGTKFPASNPVTPKPFDFRTPVLLNESELRRLRGIHNGLISTVTGRLSSLLRADLSLTLKNLTAMPYGSFAETMSNPTHITLFKVDHLPGIGILEISCRLAISMSNRMLGGRGITDNAERHLTEIEIALLEEIVDMITQEWCRLWRDDRQYTARQIGNENNPRFLQACSNDTLMLIVSIEAFAGESVEQIQLAVPYGMIEPIMKNMQTARDKNLQSQPEAKPQQWRNSYNQISVPLIADWQVPGVALSDVLRMRVGDIMDMPTTTLGSTRVRIAKAPRFQAQAGCENGHVAIQINSEITNPNIV